MLGARQAILGSAFIGFAALAFAGATWLPETRWNSDAAFGLILLCLAVSLSFGLALVASVWFPGRRRAQGSTEDAPPPGYRVLRAVGVVALVAGAFVTLLLYSVALGRLMKAAVA